MKKLSFFHTPFFNSQPKFSQYSVGKIQDTVAQIARKIKNV